MKRRKKEFQNTVTFKKQSSVIHLGGRVGEGYMAGNSDRVEFELGFHQLLSFMTLSKSLQPP